MSTIEYNPSELGDGMIEIRFLDQTNAIEVRVASAGGGDAEWALNEIDDAGSVVCGISTTDLVSGANDLLFRYAYPPTGQTGPVDTVRLYRGEIDYGDNIGNEIAIPIVQLSTGGIVDDAIFEVQLHEPDINPGTVASFDLLIPDTSGSLSVINTQGRLLGIEFRSADYEYAYVQTYNFEPYNGNLAIYRRTGASFTGDIEKMVGGIVSPVSATDGVAFVTLMRHDENGNRILAHEGIALDGSNPDFDSSVGRFSFSNLSGGHEYHLYALWPEYEYEAYWHNHSIAAQEAYDLGGTMIFNLDEPVLLIQHQGVQFINFHDRLWSYMDTNASDFGNAPPLRWLYRGIDEIDAILTDGAHPLHDNVWMVLSLAGSGDSNNFMYPLVEGGFFRNLSDLGIVEANYQPAYQPNGIFYGMPNTTGNHLVFYYNKSLISLAEVPTSTDELLALDPAAQPAGALAWIGFPETSAFRLIPWLTGFGGAVVDVSGTPTLDTPEMVAALQFVLDLRTAGIVASDPTGNDFLNYATSSDMFVNGDTAMIIAGDSQLGWLRDMLGTNLGIAPLPTVSSTGLLAVGFTRSRNFYIVDRGDPGVEQALADMLLDALDEADIEGDYTGIQVDSRMQLPALIAAQDLPTVSDQLTIDLIQAIPPDNPRPEVALMSDIWSAIGTELPEVLLGTKTPTEAAAAMQLSLP